MGATLRSTKDALLTFFEVVAYGSLLLLLPSVLVGLLFDSVVGEILAQVVLVAVAGTAILTGIAIHEGWYFEHLSGWGVARERVEPSLTAESGHTDNVAALKRQTQADEQEGSIKSQEKKVA